MSCSFSQIVFWAELWLWLPDFKSRAKDQLIQDLGASLGQMGPQAVNTPNRAIIESVVMGFAL